MSPREMVARLTDRFALLGSASRSREARHRTLRSAIDWSHDLLSPAERLVFARLSVFAGGVDLEAAEAVCAADGGDRADNAETAWTLLGPLALAASNEPSVMRATALRGLALMAWSQSDFDEAEARCRESLEMCRDIGDAKGEVLSLEQLAQISHKTGGDFAQARAFANEALGLARHLDDQGLLARCLFRLGVIDWFEEKQADAAGNLETAAALAEQIGDDDLVAASMLVLGHLAATKGELRVAGARLSRALSRWREQVSPRQVALILDGLALAAADAGEGERATCLAAASRAIRRRIGTPTGSRLQRLLEERLGPPRKSSASRAASARGAHMSLPAAVAYALREDADD